MYDTALRGPATAPGLSRLIHTLRMFFAGLDEGLAAYRRYQALSTISDDDLVRRGLRREDIVREAMFPSRLSHG